jgi:hypothetical protein
MPRGSRCAVTRHRSVPVATSRPTSSSCHVTYATTPPANRRGPVGVDRVVVDRSRPQHLAANRVGPDFVGPLRVAFDREQQPIADRGRWCHRAAEPLVELRVAGRSVEQ